MKGISARGIHSFYDLNLVIADRKISPPVPKRITDTVPYMSGEYDFSKINGEVALEAREIYYEFDLSKVFTEIREKIQQKFLWWLYQIVDADIYDDYIPGYHFHGSLKNINYSENWEKSTIGVTFSVDPYKYSNDLKYIEFEVFDSREFEVISKSVHKIQPIIETTSDFVLSFETKKFSIKDRKVTSLDLLLNPGRNIMKATGTGKIKFIYREEVL